LGSGIFLFSLMDICLRASITAGMSMALGQLVLHVLQPTQSQGPEAERASSLKPVWAMRMIAWGFTSMMC
jgi:hypothetical protein